VISAEYNSKVVRWEQGFSFDPVPTSDTIKVTEAVSTSVVGAAFICGSSDCVVFYVDSSGVYESYFVSGPMVVKHPISPQQIKPGQVVILCGFGVLNGLQVVKLCELMPNACLYVCPLVEHLPAFGMVAGVAMLSGLVRPCRDLFYRPNYDVIDGKFQEFDPKLDGDGLGRMAHLVQSYTPVINQMMTTPCLSFFYDRVICENWDSNPIFLMGQRAAEHYFPTSPISVRNYAAIWIPVSIKNTDIFKKDSNYEEDFVNIMVSSEYIPGLNQFLSFYHLMCGRFFVVSNEVNSRIATSQLPIFRYNKAYSRK
jgi:hypothetical protein